MTIVDVFPDLCELTLVRAKRLVRTGIFVLTRLSQQIFANPSVRLCDPDANRDDIQISVKPLPSSRLVLAGVG